MVEALCPGSKADVFARTQRDGWASYGDEVSA
jgi:N6-adenosine-specific RNA methylase IME4